MWWIFYVCEWFQFAITDDIISLISNPYQLNYMKYNFDNYILVKIWLFNFCVRKLRNTQRVFLTWNQTYNFWLTVRIEAGFNAHSISHNCYSIFIVSWLSVCTNGSQKASTSFLEGKLQIFPPIKLRRDISFSNTSLMQLKSATFCKFWWNIQIKANTTWQ